MSEEGPRVLVCGGREYTDMSRVYELLDRIKPSSICHGGANGADTLAGLWAESRGVYCQVFPADWKTYGKRAGPMRNRQMIDSFEPDMVVAFPGTGPGRGTADMIRVAERRRVTVMIVSA